jgi:hypothetical protein
MLSRSRCEKESPELARRLEYYTVLSSVACHCTPEYNNVCTCINVCSLLVVISALSLHKTYTRVATGCPLPPLLGGDTLGNPLQLSGNYNLGSAGCTLPLYTTSFLIWMQMHGSRPVPPTFISAIDTYKFACCSCQASTFLGGVSPPFSCSFPQYIVFMFC